MRRSLVGTLLVAVLAVPCGHLAGPRDAGRVADRLLPAVEAAPPAAAPAAPALRGLAAARDLRIGAAVSTDGLAQSAGYRDRLRSEFNSVTPENAMKWSRVEPERGRYDWAPVDAVVDAAVANNQTVRGHTLLWHQSIPDWVTGGSFSDEELRAILKRHVEVMMRRYAGRVGAWDVANEVLDADGRLRSSFWLERLGEGYLADVFRWARAADPRAKLYLNDYDTEYATGKRAALYALVRDLRARGVPVDGVGFQTHVTTHSRLAQLPETLRMFAGLGAEVAITELDVRLPLPVDGAKLTAQAEVYRRAAAACLAVARCVSLTVWGFTDAHSWVPLARPGWGAAHLFDEGYRAKPGYAALRDALAGRDFTAGLVPVHSGRCLRMPGVDAGARPAQGGCRTVDAQRFDFHRVGPETYTVRNRWSGRCLTVPGAGTADGADLAQHDCAGGDHQRFTLRPVVAAGPGSRFRLVAAHSGRCVEVAGGSPADRAPVQQRSCGTGEHQVWRLTGAPGHR